MLAANGVDKSIMMDNALRLGVNIYKGKLVYEQVAQDLELPYTELKPEKYL
jgi:alanine dehydrogenase